MGQVIYWMAIGAVLLKYMAYCDISPDTSHKHKKSPNIIFLLTDDQDLTMDSLNAMKRLKSLVADKGAVFDNMFVASPLCCPSRASILTGKYVHNHGTVNNSLSGNCASRSWQKTAEKKAFAPFLKLQGYKTFFAGKYLNQYGKHRLTGGVKHIPVGWDEWNGLVGNSKYYDYILSANGMAEKHGKNYQNDYLTDVIGRRAQKFLKARADEAQRAPFFMMLSTPACHAPFTPAPKYGEAFSNMSAPRGASFGVHGQDKHWLIRNAKHPMSNGSIQFIDNVFRNRWRTLLSVDDIVEDLITTLEKSGLLNDTYIIYTSDNGYHLGQFSMPNDKRQMYDFDVRVPFMIRGPGIQPGTRYTEPILNIDLAPTFLDMAGHKPSADMDGNSILPLLRKPHANSTPLSHRVKWRNAFIVEHQGEWKQRVQGCPQYDGMKLSNCNPDCVCEDAANNTYTCLRLMGPSIDTVYCRFSDKEDFVEVYDMLSDPNQMTNIARALNPRLLARLDVKLIKHRACSGKSCRVRSFIHHLSKQMKKAFEKTIKHARFSAGTATRSG